MTQLAAIPVPSDAASASVTLTLTDRNGDTVTLNSAASGAGSTSTSFAGNTTRYAPPGTYWLVYRDAAGRRHKRSVDLADPSPGANVVPASGTSVAITGDDDVVDVTLTGNVGTLTLPSPTAGRRLTLILRQDATGSRTVTWPAVVEWPASTAPTLTTTASHADVVELIGNGTKWLATVVAADYTL